MGLEAFSNEEEKYRKWQDQQLAEWEARCGCCGACCGLVDEDPCEHLVELQGHRYTCQIYENRFGLHKTRNGRPFKCVPLRDILHTSWPGDRACAYKKHSL